MSESDYAKKWDQQYFQDYYANKEKSLWDVENSRSIGKDYLVVKDLVNRDLPILDIGCGVGKEVDFLSQYFPKAIGLDISKYAIRLARSLVKAPNVEFLCGDITDRAFAMIIRERFGPLNIYMRGVLHQIEDMDMRGFIGALTLLCGQEGKLVFNEVSSGIRNYLQKKEPNFQDLPKRMQQVFVSDLPPKGVSRDSIESDFSQNWNIDLLQPSYLATNICFTNGDPIQIPSYLAILSPDEMTK